MEKKVYLLDYNSQQHEYTIKDFEKVKGCFIKILSGDWVLHVLYEDNYEVFDTGEHCGGRFQNFYDGTYVISPKRIDELKDIKNNYGLKDML